MVKQRFENHGSPAAPSLSAHVLLLDGGRVLMVRRAPGNSYAPGMWHASVAGKVEAGEDVVTAAVRECGEELGVRVRPADLEFAHVVHSHEGDGWVHFFFVCRSWEGSVTNREPRKHAELAWFPAHQLPRDTVGYCAQAVTHFLLGDPFSQHRTPTPFPARQRSAAQEAVLGDAGAAGSLDRLLEEVARERRRQQSLYGVQNLSPGTGPEHGAQAARAKARVDRAGADPTWWDLAYEELCEARAAATDEELRAELVQACAVLVQWAQSTLRRPRPAARVEDRDPGGERGGRPADSAPARPVDGQAVAGLVSGGRRPGGGRTGGHRAPGDDRAGPVGHTDVVTDPGGGRMNEAAIRVYGADWCRDCRRTKKQLTELAVPFEYIDVEHDPAATERAREISGRTNIPVVVYPDGSHDVEPDDARVEARLRELSLI